MEGSASQTCCTSRQRRMEHCPGINSRERRGNVGACGGRSEQITGSEKAASGRGTSEQAPSGQHSHLQLANKQDPGVPSTFTGLLVFNGRKQKSSPWPDNRNRGKENVGCLTKNGLCICVLFCFGLSVCCFPRCWPETVKSNSVSERRVSVQPRCAHNGQVYLTPSTRLSV